MYLAQKNIMGEYKYYNGKRFKLVPGKTRHYCSKDGEIYSSAVDRLLKTRMFGDYVQVNLGDETIFVHQVVAITYLGHIRGDRKVHVDHINKIKTDNRLENLRVVSARFNIGRDRGISSRYTGVCWSRRNQKWVSHIRIDGKLKYLGSFKNEEDAAEAYQKAKSEIQRKA